MVVLGGLFSPEVETSPSGPVKQSLKTVGDK